jgi:acyl-ACP thioesterase
LGYRNTAIFGEDGEACVLSWSVGAFVEKASGKMARLPPEIGASVTYDDKDDMAYLDKRIVLPASGGRRLAAFPVRRGDIDLNGHMNNARYADAALELLPEDFQVRRLRIEYKTAALQGAVLYPLLYETGDACCIVLADRLGHPYTVIEFT